MWAVFLGKSNASPDRFIASCTSWNEFWEATKKLSSKKEKGDVFERLTQLYLQTVPEYQSELAHVWALREVPPDVRKLLALPAPDEGIDFIARTHRGKYWAIQSKFRSQHDKPLTRKELGTFTSLAGKVLPWFENRKKELANRPLIREQAFGEALDPDKLERLGRYEVHLDRKLERMLTMLLRLKDLRRTSVESRSVWQN
jgi:hypothetical protein